MKSKIILWAALVILGTQLITPISASASTWLYYDDGDCGGWKWLISDSTLTPMKAVRFTDIEPCKLLKVKYYITDDFASYGYSFTLHIMDSNWVDIYAHDYTPYQAGWNIVDLSGEVIIVTGQFIVGMELYNNISDPGNPGDYVLLPDLCGDHNPGEHSWYWEDYPSGEPSVFTSDNHMIRAEVEFYGAPSLTQWGLIIMLIVLAGIATWVVLKRRRVVTA